MDFKEEDRIRLLDIADSIREIQAYVGNSSFEEFLKEEDQMQAINSHLLQIGGAAALLTDEFKEKHSDVDWDVLKGLQYANYDKELELDLHPIWHIINVDLAEIMQKVTDISLTLEKQEMADDEGIDISELEEPEDLYKTRKRGAPETDDDAWAEITAGKDNPIVRMSTEKIDRIDIADDSFIDQRFEDVDLMGDSSLDDEVYPEEEKA